MNIGAIGANPLLFLNSRPQGSGLNDPAFTPNTNVAANSARSLSILPSSSAVQLSFNNILALQSLASPEPPTLSEISATQKFLAEARKTPVERMREQVLEQLGLTDDSLAQLPPEEKRVAEDKIREMIEEKLRQAMGGNDEAPDSNSSMLEQLVGA
jgi:hypothetical protein